MNRKRGRMAGQLRIRNRYKKYSMHWYDLFMVSKDEMKDILQETEWYVERFIDRDGPFYIAIIEKR